VLEKKTALYGCIICRITYMGCIKEKQFTPFCGRSDAAVGIRRFIQFAKLTESEYRRSRKPGMLQAQCSGALYTHIEPPVLRTYQQVKVTYGYVYTYCFLQLILPPGDIIKPEDTVNGLLDRAPQGFLSDHPRFGSDV